MNLKNIKIDINFVYPLCILLTLVIAKIAFLAFEANLWLSAMILIIYAANSSLPYFWQRGMLSRLQTRSVWLVVILSLCLTSGILVLDSNLASFPDDFLKFVSVTAVIFWINLETIRSFTMQELK